MKNLSLPNYNTWNLCLHSKKTPPINISIKPSMLAYWLEPWTTFMHIDPLLTSHLIKTTFFLSSKRSFSLNQCKTFLWKPLMTRLYIWLVYHHIKWKDFWYATLLDNISMNMMWLIENKWKPHGSTVMRCIDKNTCSYTPTTWTLVLKLSLS